MSNSHGGGLCGWPPRAGVGVYPVRVVGDLLIITASARPPDPPPIRGATWDRARDAVPAITKHLEAGAASIPKRSSPATDLTHVRNMLIGSDRLC
jgi:hypothetical protein